MIRNLTTTPTGQTTDMGMKRGMLISQAERILGPRPTGPTTDMGMNRSKQINKLINIPDFMKPQFRINSLDKKNNDPLKTGSIDSFKGNTDIKPIPSATFSGSVSKIPNLTLQ